MENILALIEGMVGDEKLDEILHYLKNNDPTCTYVMHAEVNKKAPPYDLRLRLLFDCLRYANCLPEDKKIEWSRMNLDLLEKLVEIEDISNSGKLIDYCNEVLEYVRRIRVFINDEIILKHMNYDNILRYVINKIFTTVKEEDFNIEHLF